MLQYHFCRKKNVPCKCANNSLLLFSKKYEQHDFMRPRRLNKSLTKALLLFISVKRSHAAKINLSPSAAAKCKSAFRYTRDPANVLLYSCLQPSRRVLKRKTDWRKLTDSWRQTKLADVRWCLIRKLQLLVGNLRWDESNLAPPCRSFCLLVT